MIGDPLHYHSRSLLDWMRGIRDGSITLPAFQRSAVWDSTEVKRLIASLLRDRPVGALLLIPANEDRFRSRPFRGSEVTTPVAAGGELVLDGQQRLTALWRAFHDEPEPLFLRVRDWDEFPLTVEAVGSMSDLGLGPVDDDGEAAARRYEERCLPFGIVGIGGVTRPEDAAWTWCSRALPNDDESAGRLERRIRRDIATPFHYRRLWHLTLPDDLSREEAIDIYIRTNESSAVTRRFDIAVALHDSETGDSLREEIVRMVEEMGQEQASIQRFFDTEGDDDELVPKLGEVLFEVSCLRCGFAPTETSYTEKRVLGNVRDESSELRDALVWTLGFLRQEGIPERRFLPYEAPIPLLAALYPVFRDAEEREAARIRRFLRAYLWRAFLTDRYSRSAKTRLREDYRAIRENLDTAGPRDGGQWRRNVPIFRDRLCPLPTTERLADLDEDCLRSPRTRDSLGRALFAISLREGRDFATGERTENAFGRQWAYRRLFPKGYLRKSGFSSRQADHCLNFALLTEETNSIIRNRPPHDCLAAEGPLARAAEGATGDELPRLVASQRIPYGALVAAPRAGAPGAAETQRLYRAFIEARARMMRRAMEALATAEAGDAEE